MENKEENKSVNENVTPAVAQENTPTEQQNVQASAASPESTPSATPTTDNTPSENPAEQPKDAQTPKEETSSPEQATEESGLTAEEQMSKQLEKPVSRPIKNPDAFNSKEKVLYEIKEEKDGNPIVVLFLFGLMCAFILLLPRINEYVQKNILKHTYSRDSGVAQNNNQNQEDNMPNKFNDSKNKVGIGDIEVFQVGKREETLGGSGDEANKEYYVTLTIFNKSDTTYTYDKKYYIELYEDDKELFPALIHSYKYIPAHGSDELKLIITENAFKRANNFKLREISTSLYEDVQLTNQQDDYMILTCNYKNDSIDYYFKDNMLEKIEEKYKVSISDYRYNELESEYNDKSMLYNNKEGFESIFYVNQDGFEMINRITLSEIQDIDLTNLKVYRYFKFRENSKIVSFEMYSQGYTCS